MAASSPVRWKWGDLTCRQPPAACAAVLLQVHQATTAVANGAGGRACVVSVLRFGDFASRRCRCFGLAGSSSAACAPCYTAAAVWGRLSGLCVSARSSSCVEPSCLDAFRRAPSPHSSINCCSDVCVTCVLPWASRQGASTTAAAGSPQFVALLVLAAADVWIAFCLPSCFTVITICITRYHR